MPDRFLGRQLGRYRITRLLGSGSFSWVYEAVDSLTGLPVALKVLRPEFTGQADAEARFRREAETAGRLRHPNIVTVRDVGQSEDGSYVAMDLLPLSLARRLDLVHRLPEAEVVRIGLDVASALAIAHSEGVVHRDIKPDNILLGDNGEAVVGDFGLARALQGDASVSAAQQVMGTPHYFSPEQARGLQVDGRSDLYSLGVTLFRAATGQLPFKGDDWYTVAKQHIESPAPSAREIVPELTPQFDALITRLLSKRPEQRFASATLLVDALAQLPTAPEQAQSLGSGSAGDTMIAPAPQSAAFRAIKRRWVQRAGAAIAIVALVASALLVVDRSRTGLLWALLRGPADTLQTLPDTTVPVPADNPMPPESLSVADINRTRDSVDSVARAASQGRRGGSPPVNQGPARITITTHSAANITVDGKSVGIGRYVGDVPATRDVKLRALLPDAPVECRWAQRDTTVRLRNGERRSIALNVTPCGRLQLDIVPADARVTFRSRSGDFTASVRADSVLKGGARSLVLPAGEYTMVAQARGYLDYTDSTVTIAPLRNIAVKWIRMINN